MPGEKKKEEKSERKKVNTIGVLSVREKKKEMIGESEGEMFVGFFQPCQLFTPVKVTVKRRVTHTHTHQTSSTAQRWHLSQPHAPRLLML